jgi:hypothetical protein
LFMKLASLDAAGRVASKFTVVAAANANCS